MHCNPSDREISTLHRSLSGRTNTRRLQGSFLSDILKCSGVDYNRKVLIAIFMLFPYILRGLSDFLIYVVTDYSLCDDELSSDRVQLQSKFHAGVTMADIEKVKDIINLLNGNQYSPSCQVVVNVDWLTPPLFPSFYFLRSLFAHLCFKPGFYFVVIVPKKSFSPFF